MFTRIRSTRAVLDPLSRAAGSDIYVRSERELRAAVGELARRGRPGRIVIADDIVITDTVTLPHSVGVDISASGGARVLVDDAADPVFKVDAPATGTEAAVWAGVSFSGLFVQRSSSASLATTPTAAEIVSTATFLTVPISFNSGSSLAVLWGVRITGTYYVDTILTTSKLASDSGTNNGYLRDVEIKATYGTVTADASIIDARMFGANIELRTSPIGSAADLYIGGGASVVGSAFDDVTLTRIRGSVVSIEGVLYMSTSTVADDVTLGANTAGSILTGNSIGGDLTSSASSGSNVLVGNSVGGTITAHASDLYQTATDSDPLNV